MSTSVRARVSKKYITRLSSERGGYGAGTPMSGADRTRLFRVRRKKAAKARSVNDADSANTSTSAANSASSSITAVRVTVDITSEGINHTSVESGTACLVNDSDYESTAATINLYQWT